MPSSSTGRTGPGASQPIEMRSCSEADVDAIAAVINDAAEAYRGAIAADRWHDPYMSLDELRAELDAGVAFWAIEDDGRLVAVMGLQLVGDVALIRHAYTRTASQGRGYGHALLQHLLTRTHRPLLVGTWAAATWAIRFYTKRGFRLVSPAQKEDLLRRYWTVPARQIEESVVLANERWRETRPREGGQDAPDRAAPGSGDVAPP